MTKTYIFIILLSLCILNINRVLSQTVICQPTGVEIELNNSCSDVEENYFARDKIILKNGYSYTPAQGNMKAQIDETLVFDTEYTEENNVPDIDIITINTNNEVGSITGIPGVSETGAGTHSIPINIPLGVGNISPQLSVNYNSQSGNGLLGINWHLSGISSISRVPQTIYYDGNIQGVQLDNADRFALDGNRLLPKNGSYTSYGTNGYIYEKEITDFSSITSYTSTPANGPEYFILTTKDGYTIEYGNTNDSRLENSENAVIVTWYINKITDRNGNYMTYTYDNSDYECVISNIEYTGNASAGQPPTNKITFIYENRNCDQNQIYIYDNAYINNTKILKKIISRTNNANLGSYEFNYYSDNIYSKLYEIKRFGNNGTEINSTIVNYGDSGTNPTLGTPYNLPANGSGEIKDWIFADFTGNGKSDIVIIVYETDPNTGIVYPDQLKLYYNTANNTDPYLSISTQTLGTDYHSVPLPEKSYIYSISDLNGDLRDDILLANVTSSLGTNSFVIESFTLLSPNSQGVFASQTISLPSDPDYRYRLSTNDRFLSIGDFDGDFSYDFIWFLEKDEIIDLGGGLFLYNPVPGTFPYLFTPSNNTIIPFDANDNNIYELYDSDNDICLGDFTGNGQQDVLIIYNNTYKVYELEIQNNVAVLNEMFSESYNPAYIDIKSFGDYNSDGKTDVLFSEFNSSQFEYELKINYSSGNSFITKTCDINYQQFVLNSVESNIDLEVHSNDFNGDGKTDILIYTDELISGSTINGIYRHNLDFTIYYSLGNNKFQEEHLTYLSYFKKGLFFNDFNGDGNCDIFVSSVASAPYENQGLPVQHKIIYINNNNFSRFATCIRDGLGNKNCFSYKSIANDVCYNSNMPPTTPDNVKEIYRPLFVVTQTTIDNAISEEGTNTTYYQYENSLINIEKGSWLGFLKYKSTLSNTGCSDIIASSEKHWVREDLLLTAEQTSGITGTPEIDKITTTYQILNPNSNNPDIYFPYLYNSTSYSYFDGSSNSTSTTNSSIDNYGNIETININKNNGDIIQNITNTFTSAGLSIPYLVETVSTVTTYSGQNPFSESTSMVYNSNNGNISQVTDVNSGIISHYELYNDYGNYTKIRTTPPDSPERFTTYTYSQDGRFVLSETSDMGLTNEYIYDPINANLIETIDPFGKTHKYEYNAFNDIIKETGYLDHESTTTYSWEINSGIANAVFSIATNTPNSPSTKIYYDKLQRPVKTITIGYNNSEIFTDITYNKFGNIVSKSEPYFSTQTPQYTTTDYYDGGYEFNEIETIISRGLSTNYSYDFNSITVTAPSGLSYTKNFDAAGNVLSSSYPLSNSVTFTYDSHGLPVNTYANNILTSSVFNNLSQQTQLSDPNAGATTYDYYQNGLVSEQTDANNKTTTLTYDSFDRIETIVYDDDQFDYDYYDSGSAYTLIESIESTYSSITYEYDDLQRISKETETIDNTNYIFEYEYDEYGNIETLEYPNGFQIEYVYDNSGFLTGIIDITASEYIWSTTDYNALGQLNSVDLKNGMNIDYTYDPTYSSLSGISFENVFDMEYEFEPETGNLLNRTNNISGSYEEFDYDDLDRLREYSTTINNITTTLYTDYDPNGYGNIISKTDVGTLTYNSGKPHAVNEVEHFDETDPNFIIPLDQQLIEYNSFNKPSKITEGDFELSIYYGYNKERVKSQLKENGQVVYTRYFLGNYEIEVSGTTTKETCYIPGPNGDIAVYVKTNGTGVLYYTLTDYQNTILALANEAGQIIEEQNFDPWGRLRNTQTYDYANATPISNIFRGYTGHEMLPQFGLINMNARLYDPLLGRMLSPDNYVQDPFNPQNYNRYAYCYNNPLKYSDPSGDFIFTALLASTGLAPLGYIIDGAIFGAIMGGTGYVVDVALSDNRFQNWNTNDFFIATGIGAFGGAITGGFWAAGSALSYSAQDIIFQTISSTASNALTSFTFNGNLTLKDLAINAASGFAGAVSGQVSSNQLFGKAPKHMGGIIPGIISGAIGGFISGATTKYIENGFSYSPEVLAYGKRAAIKSGINGGIVGGLQAARYSRNLFTGKRRMSREYCPRYISPLNNNIPNAWEELEPWALTITINKVNIPLIGWKFNSYPSWTNEHWPAWQQNFPILIPFIPWIEK